MALTDKEKEEELWKRTFFLIGNQQEKDWLWRDFASDQFAQVVGRLYQFYGLRIIQSDPSITYSVEFNKRIHAHVGETVGLGFFIYCSDAVDIRHEFKDYFSVKHYNDPGLKEYLMKEVEQLVEGENLKEELNPPSYVFEVIKKWSLFYINKIIPNDGTFNELQSETQKEVYLTQIAWLICLGYVVTALQKRYHDSRHHPTKKPPRLVGG